MKTIKLYLIIIIALGAKLTYGQSTCITTLSETNPQSPVDLRGQPFINETTPSTAKFDWLQNNLPNYFEDPNTGVYVPGNLISPFNDQNSLNTYHLSHQYATLRDNKPEDGWELISVHFGTEYSVDPTGSLIETRDKDDHPIFVLYNKFTGILRVFVFYNKLFKAGYDHAFISLYPENTSGNQAALLSHFEVNTRPLVEFHKELKSTVVNTKLVTGSGEWLYADFAMAYDPCVCYFEYNKFIIDVRVLEEAQIDLSGIISMKDHVNITSKTQSNNKAGDFWQTIEKADKQGQTMYKNGEKFKKFITNAAPLFMSDDDKKANLKKLADNKLLKAIPHLGYALGVLDFFVGSTDDDSPNSTQKSTVITSGSIKLSGSIINEDELVDRKFYVPGAKHTSTPTYNSEIPYYNEPLGVFTLIEPPIIKYVEYEDGTAPPTPINKLTVRQYKVTELPKYKINPSSGLEIEEMKVSIVLDYGKNYEAGWGEFQTNQLNPQTLHNHPVLFDDIIYTASGSMANFVDYSLFEQKAGFNLEKELNDSTGFLESVRLTLGQVPIGCFQNTTFYLTHYLNKSNQKVIIKLRFNLILKEVVTGKLHKLVHIYNVPDSYIQADEGAGTLYYSSQHNNKHVGIKTFVNSVFGSPSSPGLYSSFYTEKNSNTLDYLGYKNEIVPSGNYFAWDLISLNENVTLTGNSNFYSYGDININPNNVIGPEQKFTTKFPDQSCYEDPMTFNLNDLSVFCNNTSKYKKWRTKATPDNKIETAKHHDFSLFPNPASNAVDIRVNIIKDANYSISVLDLSGRSVFSRVATSQEFNAATITINTSSFNSGIYFVNVTEGENRMTKRLIIAR